MAFFCSADTENVDAIKIDQEKRTKFYKLTRSLIRAYAELAAEMEEVGYSLAEAGQIKKDVSHYEKVYEEIQVASADYIDLKAYEPGMRHLIDSYIRAEESLSLTSFEDMSLVEILVREGQEAINRLPQGLRGNLAAETIKPNIRRLIVDRRSVNPAYYDKMSNILKDLIKQANDEAIGYQEYLQELIKLAKMVLEPHSGTTRPASITTKVQAAIFDNVEGNEALTLALDEGIRSVKQDGWKTNRFKKKQVLREISKIIEQQLGYVDEVLADTILDIAGEQHEY